jgi:hypothetical protein
LTDNLFGLLFYAQLEFTERERQEMQQRFLIENLTIPNYTIEKLEKVIRDLYIVPKNSIVNPLLPQGNLKSGGDRTFFIVEEGYMDGSAGAWAEDLEDHSEGFLEAEADVFWVCNPDGETWDAVYFTGRNFSKKRRVKGKGKGAKGRRNFRSYALIEETISYANFGKGKRPKGKFGGKGKGKGKFGGGDFHPKGGFTPKGKGGFGKPKGGGPPMPDGKGKGGLLTIECDQETAAWLRTKGKGKGKGRRNKKNKAHAAAEVADDEIGRASCRERVFVHV